MTRVWKNSKIFCDDIWSFCGKEILEECEKLSVDALFAQAELSSSDEENERYLRFQKLTPKLSMEQGVFLSKLAWTLGIVCESLGRLAKPYTVSSS